MGNFVTATQESQTARNLNTCDPRFFDDPWDSYAYLRSLDTLYRDEPNNLWIAARHEDVFHFSRNPEMYSNRFGVRPLIAADMSLIAMDPPEHTETRRLINKGFTPRQVRNLVPHVRELSNQIIDEVRERGQIDFVEEFAIHVPLIVISELMGLDPDIRLKMYRWSDDMMDGDGETDPESPKLHAAAVAFGEYAEMCTSLIEERRTNPTDDLISILVEADSRGALEKEFRSSQGVEETIGVGGMQDDDLFLFLALLLVAGNETTRNAISGGLQALSRFPEERQRLLDNLDNDQFVDLAVDELIRYVTPVMSFMRTVVQPHTYKGIDFKEGDRIFLLYQSANRDERVFERPDDLILDRNPNPHLAFGIGPHYCLGANLARMEVKVVYQELLKRLPDIFVPEDAELDRGDSTLVLALRHLPAHFTPRDAQGCPIDHSASAAAECPVS